MKPIYLSDYIQVLKEHIMQIVIVFLCIFIPIFLISFEIVSTYESSSTLFIEKVPLKSEEIIFRRGSSRIDITKEIIRLKSADFARDVVRSFSEKTFSNLYDELSLKERIFQRIKKVIGEKNYFTLKKLLGKPINNQEKLPEFIEKDVIKKVMELKNIKYRGEGVVTIEAKSNNPEIAYNIVNTYINIWKALNLQENKRDLELAKEFIESEVQKAKTRLDNAENDYRKYREYLGLPLQTRREEWEFMDMDPELARLATEVTNCKESYNAWYVKLREILVWESLVKSDIAIIDPPHIPEKPSGSSKGRIRIMGFLLALIVSIGLPLLIDFLKDYVKHPIDIEQAVNLPVVSVIPFMKKE